MVRETENRPTAQPATGARNAQGKLNKVMASTMVLTGTANALDQSSRKKLKQLAITPSPAACAMMQTATIFQPWYHGFAVRALNAIHVSPDGRRFHDRRPE
jgi:hypothetical protein